jgi:hypothetical protein
MAEIIPDDFILIPNRYLIQEEAPGSCIGTIAQEPGPAYGSFANAFTLKQSIPNPAEPENPGDPVYPATITLTYTKVVFKREEAQEVNWDGKDYLLVHCDSILGFIPPA